MTVEKDRGFAALRRAALVAAGLDAEAIDPCEAAEFNSLDTHQIRQEIETVLMGRHCRQGLQRLHDEGALPALLPEVAALVGFGEDGRRHKDVWEHTKRVVSQSPQRVAIRWAALLHDVGKVPTRKVEPDGQVLFHGHAEVGARMVKRVLRRLEFPKELGRTVWLLVLLHQRPSQYEPGWTDSAVRRFGKETAEVLDELLDLSRADMTTKYDSKRRRGHELIDELSRRINEIRELDARVPPLPKGLGSGIIERFKLQPGPRIGELRRAVEEAVEGGELEAQLDIEDYLHWLELNIETL